MKEVIGVIAIALVLWLVVMAIVFVCIAWSNSYEWVCRVDVQAPNVYTTTCGWK